MDIRTLTIRHIEYIKSKKKPPKVNWIGGVYEEILSLSIDERGQLGEELCVKMLRMKKCKVKYDPNQTGEEKGWDLISDGIKIEVKLATLGKSNPTFQHESLHPQRDFNGIILFDVAPNDIYLTCLAKKEIKWKKLHHRKNSGVYKMDRTLKSVKVNKIKTVDDFYKKYLAMVAKINLPTFKV